MFPFATWSVNFAAEVLFIESCPRIEYRTASLATDNPNIIQLVDMDFLNKNVDTSILLAPIVIAVYLMVSFESYLAETTAFNYVFQM